MELVNLTPHELNILVDDSKMVTLAPTGAVARVEQDTRSGIPLEGIPVHVAEMMEISGLPDPEDGKAFIVSGIVEANTDRGDVYSPGPLVRDEKGRPVGCEGLKQTV